MDETLNGIKLMWQRYYNKEGEILTENYLFKDIAYTVRCNCDGKIITYYYNKDGQYHREDGPAVFSDNFEYWYQNEKLHRIGGPAVINTDGTKKYWIKNKEITEEQHNMLCDLMKLKGLVC